MGPTDLELNPGYLRDILQVLQEYKVAEFKCAQFSLTFEAEEHDAEADDDEEGMVSTDVRGFVAPASSDDDDDHGDDHLRGHRALLGVRMPSLAPKRETPAEAAEPTPPYSVFKKD